MCVSCKKSQRVSSNGLSKDNCAYLYTELVNLDFKILDIFDISKDSRLIETNTLLRSWIKNLKSECPPTEDLNIIRNYIEDEYPKYFK